MCILIVFFSSGRRHTSCALGTGFQTCVLPICPFPPDYFTPIRCVLHGARHRGCCCMEFAASVCPIFAPRCAGRHGGANAASAEYHHQRVTDRKSVVSGKSVSVRVDLGCRRSIKKKIKKIHKEDNHFYTK